MMPFMRGRLLNDGKILPQEICERLSIISAMSGQIAPVDVNTLEIPSTAGDIAYIQRLLNTTLNKPYFKRLELGARKPAEYLMLDCCEETFGVFKVGNCFYDDINSPQVNKFLANYETTRFDKLDYIAQHTQETKQAILRFGAAVRKFYNPEKIIINRARYAFEAISDGKVQILSPQKQIEHSSLNFVIDWFLDELEKQFPEATVFEMPSGMKTDLKYPTGVLGIHYEKTFYDALYNCLMQKMREDEEPQAQPQAQLPCTNSATFHFSSLKETIRAASVEIASARHTLNKLTNTQPTETND
jgi:hypothetical protein